MATKNPKISAYVPQEVFDRFQAFQEERGLSASKAVTAILCDYFGIEQTTSSSPSGIRITDFEELKRNFQLLNEQVQILQEKVDSQPIYQDASFIPAEDKSLEPKLDIDSLPSFLDSELLESSSEPLQEKATGITPLPSVLSGKEFAKHLSISSSKLSAMKRSVSRQQFIEWSKELDSDSRSWDYRPKQKGKGVEYFPVQ